ncbi:Cof-type HAD-IIB family hydrolase [Gracilinema caldarium]|uniref:Cof-like hydrolase n=1 Tax=Gracilinema caldarium (strain ATCC 51460 / DSM 7334 / H1) TaxID=744872 RepID=F8F298_GRAC1|nr:Cof-type HAD-IIB family hydrolase [Gracilinema caldarium]AEJ20880.1 Cof-like hydrolase [Gracilinema caldarium DSM 7334]
MHEIKLLALDLDDTLLREDLTISFHTKNVLKRVEAAGVIVMLASGRSPAAMDRYARDLGLHKRPGYLVCNNGTTILESHTGTVIKEFFLPMEAALAVYDLVDAEGFPVQIYDEGTIYVSRRNEYADIDQKLTGQRQVVVDNFRSFLAAGAQKMVVPGDPALLRPLETILKTFIGDRVTIFTSKPYFLEILPPATGKGEALAIVAQLLGIDRSQVMAIGDSMNDESMIRWAGFGVAMANGDPRIKAIAKAITNKTNEEDGVAEFVEQYILKGQDHAG